MIKSHTVKRAPNAKHLKQGRDKEFQEEIL